MMIQQYLDNADVVKATLELVTALLEQEQFFLNNYTNAITHPDYLALTQKVNHASLEMANVLSALGVPLAFTHKITLIDDSMDIGFLANAMISQFNNNIAIESKTPSQLVLYTNAEHASAAKVSLYETNNKIGMISCFNIVQRTNKPYIVGLHTWQEARHVQHALGETHIKMAS